jgi:hypothetical protein
MAGRFFMAIIILALVASLAIPGAALGQEEAGPGFAVARLVMAEDVVDREPVGVSDTFPASADTVYCFLDAADVARDTEVAFAWSHEGEEVALVTLLLKAGPRWRTFSSKQIAGRTGAWSVALRDAQGETIQTIDFTVK